MKTKPLSLISGSCLKKIQAHAVSMVGIDRCKLEFAASGILAFAQVGKAFQVVWSVKHSKGSSRRIKIHILRKAERAALVPIRVGLLKSPAQRFCFFTKIPVDSA
jgi:hypothetical protein